LGIEESGWRSYIRYDKERDRLQVSWSLLKRVGAHVNAKEEQTGPSFAEFVMIIALMMSLTALSTDAMLPALPQIGSDLGVQNANDRQLVVSVVVLGLAFGQLFFGPLSDRVGRKPSVYAGYTLYIAGAILSVLVGSFSMMLGGGFCRGSGFRHHVPLPWLWCVIDTRAGRWPG
jgi:MFS family permease